MNLVAQSSEYANKVETSAKKNEEGHKIKEGNKLVA
jgi:hypothetical protein